MEKDFHYYLTYAMVMLTGFAKPDVIAYACQFTDDNNEGQFSIDGKLSSFPERLDVKGGSHYYPVMTQSLSPKSLDPFVQKYVYPPFHFLPGDGTIKINKSINPLSTTPNSANASRLLATALESKDPYRIGIALHTMADTWSHQNFSGMQEDWNSVYPWYNVFKSMVPNIGHAEAGHSPDVISENWIDHRLGNMPVCNAQRAYDAAKTMYRTLSAHSKKGTPWKDVQSVFQKIMDEKDYDKRIAKISKLTGDSIPNYNKNTWIDAALTKNKTGKVTIKRDFQKSDWYQFHQAAKAQLAQVAELTKAL